MKSKAGKQLLVKKEIDVASGTLQFNYRINKSNDGNLIITHDDIIINGIQMSLVPSAIVENINIPEQGTFFYDDDNSLNVIINLLEFLVCTELQSNESNTKLLTIGSELLAGNDIINDDDTLSIIQATLPEELVPMNVQNGIYEELIC